MKNCIFYKEITDSHILYQTPHFKLVFDIDPIQTGHLLLISNVHYGSITELPTSALHDLIETQAYLVQLLETQLPIDGVTVASNDNYLMDDKTHFHIHLIPRRKEDGFWDTINIEQLSFSLEPFLEKLKR